MLYWSDRADTNVFAVKGAEEKRDHHIKTINRLRDRLRYLPHPLVGAVSVQQRLE